MWKCPKNHKIVGNFKEGCISVSSLVIYMVIKSTAKYHSLRTNGKFHLNLWYTCKINFDVPNSNTVLFVSLGPVLQATSS